MARTVRFVFSGGLGNQLFQYSAYLYVKLRHKEIKVIPDIDAYRYDAYHNGFEVQKILDVDFKELIEATEKYRLEHNSSQSELRRIARLCWYKLQGYKTIYGQQISSIDSLDRILFGHRNNILAGYWGKPFIVQNISAELFKLFDSKIELGDECNGILDRIKDCISVSLHVRRGDYLNIPNYDVFNGLEYYKRSIKYFRDRFRSPIFLIFSNDPEWVKENLNLTDSLAVTCNCGESSYKDLLMMARCNHNIIVNSTFSWWGAWLNTNPDKIVICPKQWFKDRPSSIMVPETWVQLDN